MQSQMQGSPKPQQILFNAIPISQDLITLIKKIDVFNVVELQILKEQLRSLSKQTYEDRAKDIDASFDQGLFSKELEEYIIYTFKINQVFSLIDFDWKQQNSQEQLDDILQQLNKKGGLDYIQRERSSQGRVFEHGCDARSVVSVITKLISKEDKAINPDILFHVKLEDQDTHHDEDEEVSEEESSEGENHNSAKKLSYLLHINKIFIQLTINANGKADLYFHAYIWVTYLQAIFFKINPNSADADFDTSIIQKKVEILRLKGLSESLKKVAANISKFPFNRESYNRFINEFGGRKSIKKMKLLEELQRALFVAQIADDKETLYWVEKILIQLLGFHDMSVRDQAVILLNMLYDGVDWQLNSAFRPVIRCIGQHFKIVSSKGIETEISINFGKFWKCGFYDWRIVEVQSTGRLKPLEILGKPEQTYIFHKKSEMEQDDDDDQLGQQAQGRFIVHSKGMKDHTFHEVSVDYQDAQFDNKNQKFLKRGTFQSVEQNILKYKKKGITAIYLMGALERDNYLVINKENNQAEYKKADSSQLAITSRENPCKMLGGEDQFKKLMGTAKNNKMKIIVDCLSRISSSRHHRRYKDLLLYYLDEEGRRKICYGTDGQSINYEDTAILNYRKLEAWDLLIDEVTSLINKFGIDGIHLDNGQAWPQILEADLEELMRLDVDGEPAYTSQDIMNGEIVLKNENHGYWNTSVMEKYPNPFFIKLAKNIWKKNPNFIIIGECWGGYMFENRQLILSRSGIIPRMYKLPQAICEVFGKKLLKDGQIIPCERQNVKRLKKWYQDCQKYLPEGSILIQSSSAHSWPYPAYLYGQGTWAAADILYFMSDIPITFMGEIDGEVYRIGQTQVFQHEQHQPTSGLKRSNSQIMMHLHAQDEEEKHEKALDLEKKHLGLQKRMTKVRSGSNLAALLVEQKEGQDLKQKEEKFKQDIGPLQGFDLKQISSHYENRRRLRREKMVLRYGSLIPLVAYNDEDKSNWNQYILAYARHSLMETAIIATNMSNERVNFWIDLTEISKIYNVTHSENTVVMIQNWLSNDDKPQYFFLQEYLKKKQIQHLNPFRSSIVSLTVCRDDPYVCKKTLMQSIERTKSKLLKRENIENDQISQIITNVLEKQFENTIKFANIIGSVQETFLNELDMTLFDLFYHNHRMRLEPALASRMVALCQRIVEVADDKEIPPKIAAQSVVEGNKLGPIVFCTPEIGRWSTVGGLGVMVDELSIGLAQTLGQEVWVISPYYDKNRKGEVGYLAKDPAGFEYKENITVKLNQDYTLGIHEGMVDHVKLIFMHNSTIFPAPYNDCTPEEQMRQLAIFGKGCLEFCCKRGIIPSICVTNDWFTGLVPAYAKHQHFGTTFNGTTFFHIAHNLEESYEGRIYPQPNQGALEYVHQLPKHDLVDPYWGKFVVNPSRCALMNSDQWGTVSPSYMKDLMSMSPLRGLLGSKQQPFAFPNGIPIQQRIKKLDAAAPNHAEAKRMIQKKYFGYQDLDEDVILLAFVGRITQQKGVHLILDSVDTLMHKLQGKVNILIGGMANMKEPYSAQCAHKMWNLRNKYPNNFWADPQQFFTDGSLVNRGTDFGLMPSIFEPGGIVQHEFFVGGTPVIAYKTGGLKDSVFEFMWDKETGNGYTFENHATADFIFACERAFGTFKNKNMYNKLRDNAFKSTMEGEKVTRAWLKEFFRLRNKVFVDEKIIQETLNNIKPWSPQTYTPIKTIEELFGVEKKINLPVHDIDEGAEEEKEKDKDLDISSKKIISQFEAQEERYPHPFLMHNYGPRYSQVQVIGSFDNWQVKHNMSFDPHSSQWYLTLHLPKGKYTYKYILNGQQWVINEKESNEKDVQGNLNNYIIL